MIPSPSFHPRSTSFSQRAAISSAQFSSNTDRFVCFPIYLSNLAFSDDNAKPLPKTSDEPDKEFQEFYLEEFQNLGKDFLNDSSPSKKRRAIIRKLAQHGLDNAFSILTDETRPNSLNFKPKSNENSIPRSISNYQIEFSSHNTSPQQFLNTKPKKTPTTETYNEFSSSLNSSKDPPSSIPKSLNKQTFDSKTQFLKQRFSNHVNFFLSGHDYKNTLEALKDSSSGHQKTQIPQSVFFQFNKPDTSFYPNSKQSLFIPHQLDEKIVPLELPSQVKNQLENEFSSAIRRSIPSQLLNEELKTRSLESFPEENLVDSIHSKAFALSYKNYLRTVFPPSSKIVRELEASLVKSSREYLDELNKEQGHQGIVSSEIKRFISFPTLEKAIKKQRSVQEAKKLAIRRAFRKMRYIPENAQTDFFSISRSSSFSDQDATPTSSTSFPNQIEFAIQQRSQFQTGYIQFVPESSLFSPFNTKRLLRLSEARDGSLFKSSVLYDSDDFFPPQPDKSSPPPPQRSSNQDSTTTRSTQNPKHSFLDEILNSSKDNTLPFSDSLRAHRENLAQNSSTSSKDIFPLIRSLFNLNSLSLEESEKIELLLAQNLMSFSNHHLNPKLSIDYGSLYGQRTRSVSSSSSSENLKSLYTSFLSLEDLFYDNKSDGLLSPKDHSIINFRPGYGNPCLKESSSPNELKVIFSLLQTQDLHQSQSWNPSFIPHIIYPAKNSHFDFLVDGFLRTSMAEIKHEESLKNQKSLSSSKKIEEPESESTSLIYHTPSSISKYLKGQTPIRVSRHRRRI